MKYRFGQCELDIDRHELRVGGDPRAIEPQVFDLLRHMAENSGRLISRDELIEAVWGGRIVSDAAISSRINAARRAVGDDGSRQAVIKTVPRRGFRFLAAVETLEAGANAAAGGTAGPPEAAGRVPQAHQKVRFCQSPDATRIAHATTGSGPPLVRAGHWLTHLEHDWHSPVWRPVLDEFGRNFAVTRYDQRGNGLSDWSVEKFELGLFVDDLEAVVNAAGLDRFTLYGTSQGAPVAIAYAVRHPDRVHRLVLQGGYVRGRLLRSATEREDAQALLTLMRHGWGKQGSPFIKAFTAMFIPDATLEQTQSVVDLQNKSTSPENAVRLRTAFDQIDVSDLLGEVTTPTLVIHSNNDAIHPLDQGRDLAAGITGAEFVLLESANHIILPQEPAWARLFEAIREFSR
jgi:pimeloyl-ACP methyl ester carboxylesterase